MDVVADDWMEEVANDEMEGMVSPDRLATPTSTPAWGSMAPVPSAVHAVLIPVPVIPTRGSKRMAMGALRPIRHYQLVVHPGPTAKSVLKQILTAMARTEQNLMEGYVVALKGRMMEWMVTTLANTNEGLVRLLADVEVREKRLMVKLLAMDSIKLELTQKAKWEIK